MTILFDTGESTASALSGATGPETVVVTAQPVLHSLIASGAHDLVVVGPDVDAGIAFDLAAAERVARPHLGVVLVRRRLHSGLLRDVMVTGVREVVASEDLSALAEACNRSRQLSARFRHGSAAAGAPAALDKLVTVFSAKGGCGKTTVATNLATGLAAAGRRVCLLDLDLAFGDVAIAVQLAPQRTIADAVALNRLDDTAVRSLVTPHSAGLDAILAPVEPGAAEAVTAALVTDLLRVLKSLYDVVVVDSPPAFTDQVLAAFYQSDHHVLVATLDIPALKNLKLALETLDMLSYPRERWHVVLNRSDAKVGLSVEDVERTLRTKIALQVPSSRAVPASINRGVPILLDQPGHPVSQAIVRFVRTQLADTAPAAGGEAAEQRVKQQRRPPSVVAGARVRQRSSTCSADDFGSRLPGRLRVTERSRSRSSWASA